MAISASMVKELRERTGAGMMDCKKALQEVDGDMELAIEQLRKAGAAKADKKAGRIAAEGGISIATAADGARAVMVEVNCETDFVAKRDEFTDFGNAVAARALALGCADLEALLAASLTDGSDETIEAHCRELTVRIGEKIELRRLHSLESNGGKVGSYVHGTRIGTLVDISGGDDELARDIAMHVAALKPEAVSETELPAERISKEKEILLAQVADSDKPQEIKEKMIQGRLNKYLKEVTLLGQAFVKEPDLAVAKLLSNKGAAVNAFVRFEVGEGVEKKQDDFAEEVRAAVRGNA